MDEKIFGEAISLRERGEFEKATRLLQSYLDQTSTTLDQQERRTAEFEIERMRRIRQDYQTTREKLFNSLRERVPDLTEDEFNRLEREGNFDVQVIDGQKLYANTSRSNLFMRVPELKKRWKGRKRGQSSLNVLYDAMTKVKEAQKTSRDYILCPQDFAVTYTLKVSKDSVPEGKTVRCWLPYPRAFPFQSDVHMTSSEPAQHLLAPPQAPHRTAYLEKTAKKDAETFFSISFIYRCWARMYKIDPTAVQPYRKDGPEYQYYTAEHKPHIDLSNDYLKKLNAQIVEGETNPYLIARRIYDYIAKNFIYQFAREYSTLDNISYYCASRKAGDCGQHGMVFIALCRMNGIPARWTTGWESFEPRGGNNMHDWCEFYIEPYGWLPADPDMAAIALHSTDNELTTSQTQELVDWLFGSMDHFRLAVNSDFGAPLFPAKNDFRSETVDFQRGEAEFDNQNLYFDKWDYEMQIEPISADRALELAKTISPCLAQQPKPAPAPEEEQTTRTTAAGAQATTDTQSTSGTRASAAPSGIIITAAASGTVNTSPSASATTSPTVISTAAPEGRTSPSKSLTEISESTTSSSVSKPVTRKKAASTTEPIVIHL